MKNFVCFQVTLDSPVREAANSNIYQLSFQMMMGYLKANGIVVPRKKVRDLLRTVDPVGTGRRWGAAVARRTYSVPCTNSLWHIDAHQKLVR